MSITSSASSAWTTSAESASGSTATAGSSSVTSASSSPPWSSVRARAAWPRQRELARVDPGLETAPRELGEQRGRGLIETPSGQLGRHGQPALDPFHARKPRDGGNFRLYFIVELAVAVRAVHRSQWFEPSQTLLLLTLAATALTGCGRSDNIVQDAGPEALYDRGRNAMDASNYVGAIQSFMALEARYPFSNVTRQAQLDLIYLY